MRAAEYMTKQRRGVIALLCKPTDLWKSYLSLHKLIPVITGKGPEETKR